MDQNSSASNAYYAMTLIHFVTLCSDFQAKLTPATV